MKGGLNNHSRILVALSLILLAGSILLPTLAQTQSPAVPEIKPQIPSADRSSQRRVFLEHADYLNKQASDSFLILNGNVQFSKGGMMMYCDSAHYYPNSESLNAFGNVRMEQGDTLFVYADTLLYDGNSEIAELFGMPVRMINRDVKLETDLFTYDLYNEFGYYNTWGKLSDKKNQLVSLEGEYVPSTKEATFYTNVRLNSITDSDDTLFIFTDTLYYNTNSHLAELSSFSEIINKSDTIFTTNGNYDTNTEIANLYDRSLVRMGRGTTLEGDTLFYDKVAGYGWARGNMVLIDSARQSSLSGEYGYYNQIIDSAYVTGKALCKEYSRGDTLFMHGREIFSFSRYDSIRHEADTVIGTPEYVEVDTNHVVIMHPRVRFFRSDMQGICDSMRFEEKDSMLYMFTHPIIWSDDRQIFGNEIKLHLNDSTIDWAELPDFGFMAQHIEDVFFNQLSGKEMIAYFKDSELSQLDVNGNVEGIMLPMENDSTYNKIINIESSYMFAEFENQAIQKMKLWPETSGTVTPLYLASRKLFKLSRFEWFDGIRPVDPEDVFIIPPQMEILMGGTVEVPVEESQSDETEAIPIPEQTSDGTKETDNELEN